MAEILRRGVRLARPGHRPRPRQESALRECSRRSGRQFWEYRTIDPGRVACRHRHEPTGAAARIRGRRVARRRMSRSDCRSSSRFLSRLIRAGFNRSVITGRASFTASKKARSHSSHGSSPRWYSARSERIEPGTSHARIRTRWPEFHSATRPRPAVYLPARPGRRRQPAVRGSIGPPRASA